MGEGVEVEHVVGCEHKLTARNVWHLGAAARGDQNVACAVLLAIHFHRVRIHQPRPAGNGLYTGARQQPLVDAVEPGDFAGAVGLEQAPVQHGLGGAPAISGGLFKCFGVVRRIAVELFWDTAHIDAGATQCTHFGQRHACTALCGHAGGADTAAAAADDKKVEVECLHGWGFHFFLWSPEHACCRVSLQTALLKPGLRGRLPAPG